jgi:hypothetical protein
MKKDMKNHSYLEVGNIRVTYIPVSDRNANSDWSGSDVIRIQAYKNDKNKSLHKGAELPIETPDIFIELISALCTVYNNGRNI